jgi:hypothetical protein
MHYDSALPTWGQIYVNMGGKIITADNRVMQEEIIDHINE